MAPAGPVTGLIGMALLIAALAGSVAVGGSGLSTPGWVAGLTCGVITNAALARGLSHHQREHLSPADWVTLARATLVAGVAALVADSFRQPAAVSLIVSLSAVALVLDAVDGWVARRTRTAATLGARFDGEVDAFLILVLSVYVARSAGAWILTIGAARYVFLVAGWLLPWMRAPLPPRHWRKVVAATQGVVLTVAAAGVLPPALTRASLAGAATLLAESFGRDVWWLRSRRDDPPGRPRTRAAGAAVLTTLAVVVVVAALVAPDRPGHLTPGGFVRLPLEGLALVALAVVLPASARRALAWVVGPALGLLVIVRILDVGFLTTFDRPFDPYGDTGYAGIGIETLRSSVGRTEANLIVAGVLVLTVTLVVVTTLALRRLVRIAAVHRRATLHAVATLAGVWLLCWAFGAQLVAGTPIASTSAAGLVVAKTRMVWADIRDPAIFAREIRHDRFRSTPGDRLLTGLRGKDVILAFVESYGRVAVQGSAFSPRVDALLDGGTRRLEAAGFSARSAFLTSPTFGGISWLAHSTMQSGVWVDSRRRYGQLINTDRFTLSQAFGRAGWRTVDDVPSNNRTWTPGSTFYHYDKVYDSRNVGYRGPRFGYANMPDQYVLEGLQRFELAKRRRRPLFAEVDLVSSHIPWVRIPQMTDWRKLGDGSIFNRLPVDESAKSTLFSHPALARAAYGRSIEYSLSALISFVRHHGTDNTVLIVLGDHQPATMITGQGAGHDVPISVIARDPAVLSRIARWGWNDGLRPAPQAPVWPMSAFRDRFLTAFGP